MERVDRIDQMRRFRRYAKRYKPQDTSHRHRLPDRQQKTVQVNAYSRRI